MDRRANAVIASLARDGQQYPPISPRGLLLGSSSGLQRFRKLFSLSSWNRGLPRRRPPIVTWDLGIGPELVQPVWLLLCPLFRAVGALVPSLPCA